MDPYSAEGELINIHAHFHQGQFQEVVDFNTSSFSTENAVRARVLQLRAQVALGQAEDVLADVQGEDEPGLIAVGALAQQSLGQESEAVATIEKLAQANGDNAIVQVVGGTVLQAAGKSEEALALLSQHSGNRTILHTSNPTHTSNATDTRSFTVDAVALIVQIHLQQNRNDLAAKEVTAARRWAQDSILVNLAESWVGLRLVCLDQNSRSRQRVVANWSNRVVRDTSRHSTFSRNSHKHHRHRPHKHSFLRLSLSSISEEQRRHNLLWTRQRARSRRTQRPLPTHWSCR